jgi:hypothetical protein
MVRRPGSGPSHALGTGPSPYALILMGVDMLLFEREEHDPDQDLAQARVR